jgi:hypothetical protein
MTVPGRAEIHPDPRFAPIVAMARTVTIGLGMQTLLLIPQIASAQLYVGGALAASSFGVHDARGGTAASSFYNSSPDSMVQSGVMEAGRMFGPSWSFGVEVSVPSRRASIAQEIPYPPPRRLQARYREVTISGVVRRRVQTWRRAQVEFAGGVGFVRSSSLERTSHFDTPSQTFGPFGDQEERTRLTLGTTAGIDVAVEVSRYIFVVPQVRLSVIPRGDPRKEHLSALGLPAIVARAGVGIRAAF